LLTALIQSPPPSLLAIEEPELAIHPGALTVIRDFIVEAQRHTQIILTTHSPELLDHFEADYIRVVHRAGDATRISPMDEDQRNAVRDSLATLGEVLRHEGLKPAKTETEGN
jgi:predicted ATPase